MHAVFVKPDHSMATTRWGIATWNDAARNFEETAEWPLALLPVMGDEILGGGQALRDPSGAWTYMFNPPAVLRVSTDAAKTNVSNLLGAFAGRLYLCGNRALQFRGVDLDVLGIDNSVEQQRSSHVLFGGRF